MSAFRLPRPPPLVTLRKSRDFGQDHRYYGANYPEHLVSRALLYLAERANSPARHKAQKESTDIAALVLAHDCHRSIFSYRNFSP